MSGQKARTTLSQNAQDSLPPGDRPATLPNVIILTSGITGSSVLTGLIGRAGFWMGDETMKKEYDTCENADLVNLNIQMFREAAYDRNYTVEFSQDAIDLFASLNGRINEEPYRNFVSKCDEHRPWVWKDPRLWLTIRVWARFVPLQNCRFIVLTRSFRHAWVSLTLRRQIRSFGYLKRYELSIRESIFAFLKSQGLSHLSLTYEDLIVRPEQSISTLNSYIGTNLTVEDLRAVYHGPLHKTPRNSPVDHLKAALIYLKNYSERADVGERARARKSVAT